MFGFGVYQSPLVRDRASSGAGLDPHDPSHAGNRPDLRLVRCHRPGMAVRQWTLDANPIAGHCTDHTLGIRLVHLFGSVIHPLCVKIKMNWLTSSVMRTGRPVQNEFHVRLKVG